MLYVATLGFGRDFFMGKSGYFQHETCRLLMGEKGITGSFTRKGDEGMKLFNAIFTKLCLHMFPNSQIIIVFNYNH